MNSIAEALACLHPLRIPLRVQSPVGAEKMTIPDFGENK